MRSFIPQRSLVNAFIAGSLVLGLSGCCGHHNDYSRTIGELDMGVLEEGEVATMVLGYYPGDADEVWEKAKIAGNSGGQKIKIRPAEKSAAAAAKSSDRVLCGRSVMQAREQEIFDSYRQECQNKGVALKSDDVNTIYKDLAEGGTTEVYCLMTYKSNITVRKMHANEDTSSVIVLAEVGTDGQPVISKEDALEIDKYFGSVNDYDSAKTPIGNRVRKTFGSEWRKDGGIDGTEKLVVIMLSDATIGEAYGYMSYVDCLPSSEKTSSNMGEIVYLNASKTGVDRYSTLAHEFQHLCNFNQKFVHDGNMSAETSFNESLNIVEGLSVLAEDETGFGLEINKDDEAVPGNRFIGNTINDYCADTESYSSTSWGNSVGDYGKAYLTMRYIADSFGLTTITDIATSPAVGLANVEACTGQPFNSLAEGMTIASLGIDELPVGYRFKNLVLNNNYMLQAESGSGAEEVYVMSVRGAEYKASQFGELVAELNENTSAVIDVTGEGKNFKFKYDLPQGYTLSTVRSKNDVYEQTYKIK